MAEQQQEHPAARKPPTAAETFAGRLRTLRLEAGQPSFRTMARTVGSISHTTLYEAASGTRLPSWPTTRAFVRACGGNEAQWHAHWCTVVRGDPPSGPAVTTPPTAPAAPPGPAAPAAPAPPVEPPPIVGRSPRTRFWTHALSLLLGLAVGVCGTLGLIALRSPASDRPDAPRSSTPTGPTFPSFSPPPTG
ncbi:helix-turn-helix domain-containing protein [Kitasatospora sp. NPDC089509]|uniref:helix-turn-helix domain-containing protein n=1 Tax=Kitasatospora sp. NPDC089509 TaxID=3364079 RepID=UPI003823F33B